MDLQTSGTGIGTDSVNYGNGNDDTIVSLTGLVPNGSNELTLTVSNVTGTFSYLGVMEITEVPEPGTTCLVGVAGMVFMLRRRRA